MRIFKNYNGKLILNIDGYNWGVEHLLYHIYKTNPPVFNEYITLEYMVLLVNYIKNRTEELFNHEDAYNDFTYTQQLELIVKIKTIVYPKWMIRNI